MKRLTLTTLLTIVLRHAWLCAGGLIILTVLAGIAQNVMIVVLADFLDSVLAYFSAENPDGNMNSILVLIGAYAGLQLFVWAEPNLFEWFRVKCQIKMRRYCNDVLLDKYSKIKYRYTEDEETQNLIERVMPQAEDKLTECFCCYLDIAGFIIKVAGILVILANVTVWTALVVLICATPLFILAVKSGRATYETAKEVTQLQRQAKYYSDVAAGKEFAYERKLFKYGDFINAKWKEKYDVARKTKLRTGIKWYVKSKMASVFTAVIGILSTIVLINPVVNGEMTVGLYISLVGAIYEFIKVMAWDFMEDIDWLTTTKEYMKDYNSFLDLEEDKEESGKDIFREEFKSLEFQNVSFHYPNSERYVLNGISFIIEANKRYCIVGTNGSGKTTIVKLILGLYDDYQGKILLNGRDIKEYRRAEIGKICSAVLQDFSRYSLSVRDNILLGGLKYNRKIDDAELSGIVSEVGLQSEIKKLKQGMDTVLGSHFKDGQDFSGGQWQRLAIARNLAGGSEIVFFDEPTAALDPIAERNFYQSLQFISNLKTTVVISHRLAVTRQSDMIYVVCDGAIGESGTFEELMERRGDFFEMYESQKVWYDEGTKRYSECY